MLASQAIGSACCTTTPAPEPIFSSHFPTENWSALIHLGDGEEVKVAGGGWDGVWWETQERRQRERQTDVQVETSVF